MIQYFKLNFKKICSQINIQNFQKSLSLHDFQKLETNLLNNIDDAHYHTHTNNVGIKERCKSPNSVYKMSYERNYIVYQDNKIIESKCKIPVVYCQNCNHFHALLPHHFIVPYCQYSLSFILLVIYDKSQKILTVEEIRKKYNISISTIYRWEVRFSMYLRIYIQIRNKYNMNIFISLLDHYETLLNDLFDISGYTFLENNCNLFKQPPKLNPL